MGIPYYFYEITRKYPDTLQQPKTKCDYLFFDYNSLIHPSSHRVLENTTCENLNEAIIKGTLEYTQEIISRVNPGKVYIVVDGVAPRAKMKQQRMRRFRNIMESGEKKWDSNQITPGTQFMKELTEALNKWAGENTIIDSSDNCGEGEHKIFQTLLCEGISNKNVYIYGLDADLIILSLLEKNNRITLFRDTIQTEEDSVDYLDTYKLRESVMETLVGSPKVDFGVILDYAVIVCFLGNDFMDSIPTLSMSSLNTLVNNYRHIKLRLTNNGKVNYRNLSKFLGTLVRHEEKVYSEIVNKEYTLDIPENTDCVYYTNVEYVATKERYYRFYELDDITSVCKNYIEALDWVIGYYTGHSHKNWDFMYKYNNAPFVSDLIKYLNTGIHKSIHCESKPLTSDQQLFLVLPKSSLKNHASEYIMGLVNHPETSVYFPEKLIVDLICKTKLFKGKVLLPDIPESLLGIV